jgi:quinoprotein glucose dehydrogenase
LARCKPHLFLLPILCLLCTTGWSQGWLHYGGDEGGSHHSRLSQIDRDNVDQLELAWSYQTGAIARHPDRKASASFHATPLLLPEAAGQSLVFCTPFNRIIALDPVSGEERWMFDPDRDLGPPGMRFNCRGIAYWHDDEGRSTEACEHRLFMGTFDLQLFAIDARTGQRCEDFGDRGSVDVWKMVREEVEIKARAIGRPAKLRPGDVQFSSPPAVIGDTVAVGSSNNTKFRRIDGPSGVVRAFDARSGKIIWTFDPVPRNPGDPQAGNWTTEALRTTGAANVWSMMSVDEERDLLFLPTASASPDFYGGTRPGDNRYANSVVALRGSTGEVAWHYQIVHHDVWDLDLPAQPILVNLRVDGQQVPVVVQLTKQGMIFVLHRETGEPVFPVEEHPVPTDGVEGEQLSPTQPYPAHVPLLVPQGVTPDDGWGFTFFDRGFCRRWIEKSRYDHYYAPPSREGTTMFPGMSVNNWGGGAFSPDRNVLIVPVNRALIMRQLMPITDVDPEALKNPMAGLMGLPGKIDGTSYVQQFKPMLSPLFSPCNPPPWGELAAVDLNAGEILWRRNLGVLDKLLPVPIPLAWGTPNSGGPIVTDGGLIFIGATMDERFRAFDVDTGEQLWETETPTASMATPMTYQIDGKQFVVIASGGHMWQYSFKIADYLVAYALP